MHFYAPTKTIFTEKGELFFLPFWECGLQCLHPVSAYVLDNGKRKVTEFGTVVLWNVMN